MRVDIPTVCLNPISTKVFESALLAHISLESPWKAVSDTAIGLHR